MKIVKIHLYLIVVFLLSTCQASEKPNQSKKLDASSRIDTPLTLKVTRDTIKTDIVKEEDSSKLVQKEKNRLRIQVSVDNISYKGLKFIGRKKDLLALMEQPDTIIEPKYECGPFSEDWQEIPFYQYFYGKMNFIVYKEMAEVQAIKFDELQTITINGIELNGRMTLEEVVKKLKISSPETIDTTLIEIYPIEPRDEHYYLKFKYGKLSGFERFEPC